MWNWLIAHIDSLQFYTFLPYSILISVTFWNWFFIYHFLHFHTCQESILINFIRRIKQDITYMILWKVSKRKWGWSMSYILVTSLTFEFCELYHYFGIFQLIIPINSVRIWLLGVNSLHYKKWWANLQHLAKKLEIYIHSDLSNWLIDQVRSLFGVRWLNNVLFIS